MGEVVVLEADRPLSNATATKRIRDSWRGGTVSWSPRAERQFIQGEWDAADIEQLIMSGHVKSSERVEGAWWYRLEGKSSEGKRMACKVELWGKEVRFQAIA